MRIRVLWAVVLLGATGCRSRFIEATIVNQGTTIHVLEFDYPSASFGANQIAGGSSFHRRFKVQGDGPLSLQYEGSDGHTHTATGPKVAMGEEGTIQVTITPAGMVTWNSNLTNVK